MNWINKQGKEIPIDQMNDQYLYNTVKMICNNTFGRILPFGNVIHWSFIQPAHTPEFLSVFFYAGVAELKRREAKVAKEFLDFLDKQGNELEENWIQFGKDNLDEGIEVDILDFGDRD